MRNLPRLPEGASAEDKIRIIYDWLYELQGEMQAGNPPLSFASLDSHQQIPE